MGQEEIQGFLRRNKPKWFTSNQLSEALHISRQNINKCLGRMRKYSEVKEKKERVLLRGKLGLISKEVPFYSFKKI